MSDFDALTAEAFPDQQMGPVPAISALWRACFALEQWLFTVHPQSAEDPQPFVTTEKGVVCLFAFTDGVRARTFAAENDLLGQDGNGLVLAVTPEGVLGWGEEEKSRGGARRLHFNFGGPGWFSPLADLPKIHAYLQTHSE